MNIEEIYTDYNIPIAPAGHHHHRPGWVNTICPFCTGNPGFHLGFNTDDSYYYCWRCGYHNLPETLVLLTGLSRKEVYDLIDHEELISLTQIKKPTEPKEKHIHRLPTETGPLNERQRKYLTARGYDPDFLARFWHVIGTGPGSRLDRYDFKHRILIPIIWDDHQVSYTARDTTTRAKIRYMTCPAAYETINHTHIIYGTQFHWKDTGICVEGPFDVWRMGFNAFCTFGIEFTHHQVRIIAKNFKRIFVLFDKEPQAVIQAQKLTAELRFRGVETLNIVNQWADDPSNMKQEDADYLVKQLLT